MGEAVLIYGSELLDQLGFCLLFNTRLCGSRVGAAQFPFSENISLINTSHSKKDLILVNAEDALGLIKYQLGKKQSEGQNSS